MWASVLGVSDSLYQFYFKPSVSVSSYIAAVQCSCSSSIMQFYSLSSVCLYFRPIFDFAIVCIFVRIKIVIGP